MAFLKHLVCEDLLQKDCEKGQKIPRNFLMERLAWMRINIEILAQNGHIHGYKHWLSSKFSQIFDHHRYREI